MRAKLAKPTNCAARPKASCSNSELLTDWNPGHTKKTNVIASCGASSKSGTRMPGNMTRLSCMRAGRRSRTEADGKGRPPQRLHVDLFELPQQIVAARHGAVERFLGGLLALQRALDFFFDDVSNLHEAAEPQALGIFRGRVQRHLLDRYVGARVLVVEALRTRKLVGRGRDRQIATLLVPPRLHIRLRQVGEEARDALIVVCLLAAQHPQRRAADNGVLQSV